MWGRPSIQKKTVFPSANKIFSHLSVGIWMHSHCRGVPYIFLFCRLSSPIPLQCSRRQTLCQSWVNMAELSRQTGTAGLHYPITGRWIWLWLQTWGWILSQSTVQCQSPNLRAIKKPQVWGSDHLCFGQTPFLLFLTLPVLVEIDHLAAAQHCQKLTCECPRCLFWEQQELGEEQISPTLAQRVPPGSLLFADLLQQQWVLVLAKPGCCNPLLAQQKSWLTSAARCGEIMWTPGNMFPGYVLEDPPGWHKTHTAVTCTDNQDLVEDARSCASPAEAVTCLLSTWFGAKAFPLSSFTSCLPPDHQKFSCTALVLPAEVPHLANTNTVCQWRSSLLLFIF